MELRIVASQVPLSALAGFFDGATDDAAPLSGTHNDHDVDCIRFDAPSRTCDTLTKIP